MSDIGNLSGTERGYTWTPTGGALDWVHAIGELQGHVSAMRNDMLAKKGDDAPNVVVLIAEVLDVEEPGRSPADRRYRVRSEIILKPTPADERTPGAIVFRRGTTPLDLAKQLAAVQEKLGHTVPPTRPDRIALT